MGLGYPRMLTPHRRPYATKDGFISVIAHSDKQWAKLFEAMGVAELIKDVRFESVTARSANIDAVYATLTNGMKQRTTDEWLAELRPADIPCGKANSLNDLFADPYLMETGYFESHEHPSEGSVVIPAIPVHFSGSPANVHRPWPKLGEHSQEILTEVGYSRAEIEAVLSR